MVADLSSDKSFSNLYNIQHIQLKYTHLFPCSVSVLSSPKISPASLWVFFPPISKTWCSQTFFPRCDAWSVYVSELQTLEVKNTLLWRGLAEVSSILTHPTSSSSYIVGHKVRHTGCPCSLLPICSLFYLRHRAHTNPHVFTPWYHTVWCYLRRLVVT